MRLLEKFAVLGGPERYAEALQCEAGERIVPWTDAQNRGDARKQLIERILVGKGAASRHAQGIGMHLKPPPQAPFEAFKAVEGVEPSFLPDEAGLPLGTCGSAWWVQGLGEMPQDVLDRIPRAARTEKNLHASQAPHASGVQSTQHGLTLT